LHIFSDFSYSFLGIWSKFQGQFPKMENFSRTARWNFSKLGQELQLTNSHHSRYSKRKSMMVEYFGGLCLSTTVFWEKMGWIPVSGQILGNFGEAWSNLDKLAQPLSR